MDDKEKQRILKEKLEEIQIILSYLSAELDLKFIFNCLTVKDKVIDLNKTLFSQNLALDEIEFIQSQITSLQKQLNFIPSLVTNGKTVVICLDDSNKPKTFKGKWIRKNDIYIVSVVTIIKNEVYYDLLDVETVDFKGFHSKRFKRIFQTNSLN